MRQFIKIKKDFINVDKIISIEQEGQDGEYKMYLIQSNYYYVEKEDVPSMLGQLEEMRKPLVFDGSTYTHPQDLEDDDDEEEQED